ncbi:adenylyltransferase/cytidyltransferase family protein [Bacillus sp. JJ722]
MEIIQVTGKPPKDTQSQILLIGKFDGVHIGHTKIIQTARSYIENDEILSVMSFTDHPLWVLRQEKNISMPLLQRMTKSKS